MSAERTPPEPALARPAAAESAPPAANEQRRWVWVLGLEAVASMAFFVALLASGVGWLVVPALLAAPIAGPLTIVYLAISSDANAQAA